MAPARRSSRDAERAGPGSTTMKEAPVAEKAKTSDVPDRKKQRQREVDALRTKLAKIVQVVFSLFALVLALGVLLVAMRANVSETNGLVKLVFHICDAIDGPFSRQHGIFSFTGK